MLLILLLEDDGGGGSCCCWPSATESDGDGECRVRRGESMVSAGGRGRRGRELVDERKQTTSTALKFLIRKEIELVGPNC